MVYYDTRSIKKLAQNGEQFVAFYDRWINEIDFESALNVLKISALYYQRYSQQSAEDYSHYFGRCVYQLLKRFPDHRDKILQTECECQTIHQAYNNFFRRIRIMNNRLDKATGSETKLNAFLIFSEISLSITSSIVKNIPSARLTSIFPVTFQIDKLPVSEDVTPEDMKSIDMIFDQICSYTGHIFNKLRHKYSLNLEYQCSEQAVMTTGNWIKEWDDFDSLNRISDLFRFCQAKINLTDPQNVSLHVDENCAYKSYEVARSRFTMRGVNVYNETKNLLEKNPDFVTKLKPVIPDWISENDFFSIVFFCEMENMSPEDLYIEYGGVMIYAWIHAYEMLVALAKQEMEARFKRRTPGGLRLKDWVIYRTRDEWIRLFAEGGISWTAAKLVTDYFTFDDRALDINDCPLLPCDEGLCLMPSIVSMSSTTRSLLSLFSSKKIPLDDKGKCHERQFVKRVRAARICAAPLPVRKDFDCDCAMVIDDHLFFIELKSNGHPLHFNRYYQTLVNILGDGAGLRKNASWMKQVTRYADYYSARPELIRKALNLPEKWQPKGFHKMIITTSVLGDVYHQDGCYVVDKTAFYSFIDRLPGQTTELKNGKRRLIKHDSDHFYHGEITIDKMLGFLDALPTIRAKRRRVQQLTYNVRCGDTDLTYPFFDIWPAYETVIQEDGSKVVIFL